MSAHPISASHFEERSSSRSFQHADTIAAGLRFHYLFQGAGVPVILLSGFPESCYAWRKVIPELAGNYRVSPQTYLAKAIPIARAMAMTL